MKLKGINPIEQNVEKIVLGVVALIALGAGTLQVLPGRNLVKVGSGPAVPAGQAFAPVEAAARNLEGRLASQQPALPEAPQLSLADKLTIRGPVFKDAPRVALGPAPVLGTFSEGPVATVAYQLPKVDAPASVTTHAFASTISPVEKVRNAELAKLLPAEQPFDKAAVSIEAAVDGTALRDMLLADPDGPGPIEPVPAMWVRDAAAGFDLVTIVGIEVERETVRLPDGTIPSKSDASIIQPPPGRYSGLKEWAANVKSLGDTPLMVERIMDASEEVLRPEYYQTIAGPEWKRPSQAQPTGDEAEKAKLVERKKRELTDVEGRIADVEQRIGALPPSGDGPRETRPGEGGGGGKGGPGRLQPSAPTNPEEPGGNRLVLERRLKTLSAQRDRLVQELEALGEKVVVDAAASNEPVAAVPVFDDPDVRIWTHDMTAEPGAVYRYRVRVVINNPLFGRPLQESQKQLAEASLIRGAWSSWSGPVEVDAFEHFFVTSATPGGDAISPSPRATAEMYVFYYGFYRVATVGVEPGDVIVGEARIPADLQFADMDKLTKALEGFGDPLAPTGAAPPVNPPPRVPGRPDPTGRGDRRLPTPEQTSTTQQPGVEWLSVPVPDERSLKVDALMMDVVTLPPTRNDVGIEQSRMQAILRGLGGQILVKSPDADRNTPVYRRVEASAQAGKNQGRPEVKPEKFRPGPRRDGNPQAPAPAGGKGGGGG